MQLSTALKTCVCLALALIVPIKAFEVRASSSARHHRRAITVARKGQALQTASISRRLVGLQEKDDSKDESVGNDEDTPMATVETPPPSPKKKKNFMSEEEASRKNLQILLLPKTINEAITGALIVFVVVGTLLNVAGYAYVWRDGWLQIDTLEARQFQNEMVRAAKEAAAMRR